MDRKTRNAVAKELVGLANEVLANQKMDYAKLAGQVLKQLSAQNMSWDEFVRGLDAAAEHYPGVEWEKKDGKWYPTIGSGRALGVAKARKRVLADQVLNDFILAWATKHFDGKNGVEIFQNRMPNKSKIGAQYNRLMLEANPDVAGASELAKKNAMTNPLYVLRHAKAMNNLCAYLVKLNKR